MMADLHFYSSSGPLVAPLIQIRWSFHESRPALSPSMLADGLEDPKAPLEVRFSPGHLRVCVCEPRLRPVDGFPLSTFSSAAVCPLGGSVQRDDVPP